jgi:hypothetical protein
MYEFWIDEEVRKATRRALGYAPLEAATANPEPEEGKRPDVEVAAAVADSQNATANQETEEGKRPDVEVAAAVADPQNATANQETEERSRSDEEVAAAVADPQNATANQETEEAKRPDMEVATAVADPQNPSPLHREHGLVASPLRKRPDVLMRQLESNSLEVDGEKTPKRRRLSSDAGSTEKLAQFCDVPQDFGLCK